MADGIRDKVAILGMGCSVFGERWTEGAGDLLLEAFDECLADSGLEKKEIQAAWIGHHVDEVNIGKGGCYLASALRLPYIPVTRVENFCASGSEAFRGACYAVAAGACDIALAAGVEKLKDTGYSGLPDSPLFGQFSRLFSPNNTAPGMFAQLATAYSARHGVSMDTIKKALTHISWKSHQNGAKNPRAHLRRPPSREEISLAPCVAYPLGLYDCCGVSDGAAMALVTTPAIAASLKPGRKTVRVKALQIAVSSGEETMFNTWDGCGFPSARRAAARAYQEAGISNPRQELGMLEVHDCFSITELVTMEDLGISDPGRAPNDVLNGHFDLDGPLPCQPDGGLKCFGHPIGASGLRMIYEVYNQLLGRRPPDRQVKKPKLGLTHNLGGFPGQNVCSISILGVE